MQYRYRKRGGEIEGGSRNEIWVDDPYFGVLVDPPFKAGTDVNAADLIWDGAEIREPTAAEVSQFQVAAAEDEKLQHRDKARTSLQNHPTTRKLYGALIAELLSEMRTPTARTAADILSAIQTRIGGGEFD